MKTAVIYLFGIMFMIKLFPLTSINADEIKVVEDKYKVETVDESSIKINTSLPKNIKKNTTKNKINDSIPIDEIETSAGIEIDNETELTDDGFARNYYVQAADPTIFESIAYSIDYIKSKINIFNNDSGFYGGIGLAYIYNMNDDGKSERSQSNFKQEYNLGYRGVVYSPKLLKYTLSTTIRYENIKDNVNGISNDNNIESYDYEAKLNFLNRTRIPFSMYAIKMQRPNTTFYEDTKNESLYDSLALGLSGQINLKIFKINYSVSDSKGTYEDIFSKDNKENRVYKTTLSKETDNHSLRLSYDNTNQMIDRKRINYSSKSNIENENVGLTYRVNISDSIRLDTQSYYKISNYTDNLWTANETQSILSNLNLSWNPKGKHYGSIGISGTSIKDENTRLNTSTSIDGIQAFQSYGYRMSKNLSISQSLGYGIVYSDINTIKNINLSSSINYTTKINSDLTMNTSISAGINSNSNDTDTNTSIADVTSYTYRANAGINQSLQSINSRLNIGFGYNGSKNTRDETKQSYNVTFGMDTNVYSRIKNQFKIGYNNSTAKTLGGNNTLLSRDSSRISVSDGIEYTTRIGIRGAFNSKVSIKYLLAQTNGEKIKTLLPNVNLLFKYRLNQKLRNMSKFIMHKELFYDITNYNFGSDFLFRSGKLSASIGYVYNKSIVGGNTKILSRDMHRIKMKFERKF